MLTRFMRLTWAMRPDLRRHFDLSTLEGQQGLVWWHFTQGPAELGSTSFITDDQRRYLNAPDERLPSGMLIPITRLMMKVWSGRADLKEAFPLDTPKGRAAYIVWYFTHGLIETKLADLVDEVQARILLTEAPGMPGLAVILAMIWSNDSVLKERFPRPFHPAFGKWAWSEGLGQYPILKRLAGLVVPGRADEITPKAPVVRRGSDGMTSGYNLIGYARGQFGIGEDVRMAALAMRAAGVPFGIYNIEPGREVSQGDDSAEAYVSDQLPYSTNLLCTTGIETARLAAVYGSALFDGRRTIGYWPWELPEWPAEWHHAYDLVDEVWASSRFTYETYAKSSPKPVRHMPMAVTVDATAGLTRRDFGLPEDLFLFVFSFDFLSSVARKNPHACLRAFRLAFPKGDEPVGLVIKVMRAPASDRKWRAFLREVSADPRILLINRTLDRGEVLDLYRASDCFISLHRSEGFGRGMAEAMALGCPVIATGYSGNMDFTTDATAALIDFELGDVGNEEYAFSSGQQWAYPSVEHAASCMLKMSTDRQYRERLVATARSLMTTTYSPEAVGRRYLMAGF